ncbi:HAD family hydrolase [Candidatus Harpocratesius sp.]
MKSKEFLNGIELIIFDYDGVLYNMIDPLRETVIEGVKKFNLQSNGLNEDMREVFRVLEFALTRSVADQILDSKEMLDIKLLDGFPLLKRLRIATFFYGDFRAKTQEPKLFDGVIDLIKKLHAKSIKLAILSNSAKKYIDSTLEAYGLLSYFNTILGAAEVKKVKPDPEGLLKIMKIEGVKPKNTLFIGDMVSDIDAGKNAQIRTIAVASGILAREKLEAAQPYALVSNIRELIDLFGLK